MIADAARRLHAGGVIGFPTETVYGLGANTFDERAIEQVYQLKGRPFDNPLIAHVRNWEQAQELVNLDATPQTSHFKPHISNLTAHFWPGPLTLVLPKADRVPARATAGLNTIAVRSPSHPVAQQLLRSFGSAISAPSANRSGRVSPTTAQHVASDFAGVDDLLILDGGASEVGIESTVLDLTTSTPRVLRQGSVTVEQLRDALGRVESPELSAQAASPGTAARHYAPRTPVELVSSAQLPAQLAQFAQPVAVLSFDPQRIPPPHRVIGMSSSADEYARSLYDALRRADEAGCVRIFIETPPSRGELWRAIHDRLKRATAIESPTHDPAKPEASG